MYCFSHTFKGSAVAQIDDSNYWRKVYRLVRSSPHSSPVARILQDLDRPAWTGGGWWPLNRFEGVPLGGAPHQFAPQSGGARFPALASTDSWRSDGWTVGSSFGALAPERYRLYGVSHGITIGYGGLRYNPNLQDPPSSSCWKHIARCGMCVWLGRFFCHAHILMCRSFGLNHMPLKP